jgi:hypothetical protein
VPLIATVTVSAWVAVMLDEDSVTVTAGVALVTAMLLEMPVALL